MGIEIVRIADRPDLLVVAAHWNWLEWGRTQGRTLDEIIAWIGGLNAPSGPEQGFVLLEDNVAAAMATLVHADLDARPDLTPWLADVRVELPFRGRGHAARLVRHVEAVCRAAGIGRCYLHTDAAAALYARLGWAPIGTAVHHGHAVTIMARDLN